MERAGDLSVYVKRRGFTMITLAYLNANFGHQRAPSTLLCDPLPELRPHLHHPSSSPKERSCSHSLSSLPSSHHDGLTLQTRREANKNAALSRVHSKPRGSRWCPDEASRRKKREGARRPPRPQACCTRVPDDAPPLFFCLHRGAVDYSCSAAAAFFSRREVKNHATRIDTP